MLFRSAERDVLDGVDLSIDHGERVAIVGPNGCGKTTLLSMLTRLFEPAAGRVLVDGTDVRTIDVRTLRAQIGVVTQEATLLKGTIEENVRFGLRRATESGVLDALRRAHAMGFVERLPGGLQAMVGEQGMSLSGGQRQRIAIARALLLDPRILILDEATSSVDIGTERRIERGLRRLLGKSRNWVGRFASSPRPKKWVCAKFCPAPWHLSAPALRPMLDQTHRLKTGLNSPRPRLAALPHMPG